MLSVDCGMLCRHTAVRESYCTIRPGGGRRNQIAIRNASQTSVAFIRELMLQPTTFLENKSITISQIQPAFPCPDVCDSADVNLIRFGNSKLPNKFAPRALHLSPWQDHVGSQVEVIYFLY